MYIKCYKITPLCGAGVEVRLNLRGGISPETPEMYTLTNKLGL